MMPDCPVCRESFGSTVCPVALPCGHVFCENDVNRISNLAPVRCPACRQGFLPGVQGGIRKLFFESKPGTPILSVPQREDARALSATLRGWGVHAATRDIECTINSVRSWTQALKDVDDVGIKVALSHLNLSLDSVSLRFTDEAIWKEKIRRARAKATQHESENNALKLELVEARRAYARLETESRGHYDVLTRAARGFMEDLLCSRRDLAIAVQDLVAIKQNLSIEQHEHPHVTTTQKGAQCDQSNTGSPLLPQLRLPKTPKRISLGAYLDPPPPAGHIKACARWGHNLDGVVPEDLCFQKDDTLCLVNKTAGVWWVGMLNGNIGCVPEAYINISPSSGGSRLKGRARRSHNLNRKVLEDLSFSEGAVIKLVAKPLGVWLVGMLNGKIGCVLYENVKIPQAKVVNLD